MSIPVSAFDQWIGGLRGGSALSMRQVAEMIQGSRTGASRNQLSLARARGVVPSVAVLGVATAHGRDPLEEISRFSGYESAWPNPKLKVQEVLILLPTLELVIELLWRGGELEMEHRKVSHGGPAPRVPTFRKWMRETLAICEHVGNGHGGQFCREWWLHPEAVYRFRALYAQYVDAAGNNELSTWWVQHWDAHAKALFDPQVGVFRHCPGGLHRRTADETSVRAMTGAAEDLLDEDIALGEGDPAWV